MKLHLGCGQRYLEGYLNMDFPPDKHTVQLTSVADQYVDLLSLCYERETVHEIRLHHVFEHFPRPVACGLLAAWHRWLIPGGILHLEVPDFKRTARVILNPLSSNREKAVAERHLYGSHEAPWAVHNEGYTPTMLQQLVTQFGFSVLKVRRSSWEGTFNFELLAEKDARPFCREECISLASGYLQNFLLDDSDSECRLLAVWLQKFNEQLEKALKD